MRILILLTALTAVTAAVIVAQGDERPAEAAFLATDYMGDVDCSETVDGLDATYVLRNLADIPSPDALCFSAANVLCDDPLDENDLLALLRFLGGLDYGQPDRCFEIGSQADSAPFSQGTATINATFFFDFDAGIATSNGADVFWQNRGSSPPDHDMVMSPVGGQLAQLNGVDYDTLNIVALNALPYGDEDIEGPPGAKNELPAGTVFAVLTDEGNYAKVRVVVSDATIEVDWVTYDGD